MKYRKGIFIVTYSKTKKGFVYLMLKRKLHWKGWEFPKGGLEKGEDCEEAVLREVKEETGKKPFNIKKFNLSGKYKYKKGLEDRKEVIESYKKEVK